MAPEISVIMSVYNGETYLEEAVESVMAQTFRDWELIIINDCSTDKTGEILAELATRDQRILVHTNEVNLKLPASLNKAISLSRGKYIARMDADDICLPNRLEKQYEFMENNPDVALSSCRFLTVKNGVYAPGGAGGRCDNEGLTGLLLVTNPIMHPGVIAKAEALKKFNYDTTLTCTEDLELWTRLVANGEHIRILPEYLLVYRLHDKQITSTTLERQHTEVLKIQQKYYASVLVPMPEEIQKFYIGGVYFKECAEINRFRNYAAWFKKAKSQLVSLEARRYALFEMLAEYKRCGVSKADILKGMFLFNPIFLAKELMRRKKGAKDEIKKCRKVAEELGLRQVGGTEEFPIFEK